MNRQRVVTGALTALAILSALVFPGLAADPAPAAGSLQSRILRVDVPADRPDVWFRDAKSLVPVPRREFEELLRAAEPESPGPRPAQVTSARYSASLTGQALRDGRGQLTVQRVSEKPVLLPLGASNLAVRDFGWTDRAATWGSDLKGMSWLLVDVPAGELQLSWSAAGRSVAGELNFDLQFPAAAISSLDLRVPRDQSVRSVPEARQVDEGSDAAWQVWRIQLAVDRRCRLTVTPSAPVAARTPTILYDYELGAVVREQDLRFQSVFQVEVFHAAASELTFTVPASVDVYAVTYGQDVPLSWSRPNKSESVGTILVKLPGPLLGRGRPIRIDGVAVQKPSSMISPQITIRDGIFVGGRHTLNIVAPLQLRSFRPTGFRQLTPATASGSGENYTFLQLLPDAQLVLDVGRPQASLTAQVHSLFEMNESTWTLTSELTWTASSGGMFRTECQFPADWEITDVRLASELGTARLAGWDVTAPSGGTALLRVEFLEALAPTVPRTLRVLARRRPLGTGQAFALPLPHPTNCYSVESTLGLILPSAFSPFVSEDARVERIAPPDESSPWVVRPRRLAENQSEFWYRRETTDGGGTLQLVSRLRRVSATCETRVIASSAEFQEHYQVRCQPEGAPIDRLLVYLTQSGSEIRWSVTAPRQGELAAQKLPVGQHADWKCPETGELWELRLPPLPAGQIQIEGRRTNRWLPLSRPALLVVPQSTDRRSSVVLRYPAALDLRVETALLERPTPGSDDFDPPSAVGAVLNERTEAWSFESRSAQLSLTIRNPERSREFPTMVSMRLRSLLSANPQGFDLYRVQLRLENGTARDQLRIRLPSSAILQQINVGGQATVPNRQEEELLVSDLDATQHELVELLYRVPSFGGEVRDVHRIVVPQVSAVVLGFTWEFAVPPSVRIYAEPSAVRLTRPLPQPSWTERMFGPLGRPADEPFFNPLAMESWQELVRPTLAADHPSGELGRDLIAPADWQVHEGISAIAPLEITLETWRTRETRLASWIMLIVNLMLGIIVRMVGWKYRDRTAAYWLALLCAVACFSPSPYAEMVGGGIAGTVIALLFPRRSVIAPRRDPSQAVPLGSTRSFDWGTPAVLLFALVLSATVSGQEAPAVPPGPIRPSPFLILVPVDESGKPSDDLAVVYVPQPLLTLLKELAAARTPPPQWLIAAADYHVSAGAGGSDSLQAQFRVHLLEPAPSVQIELPIAQAFLTGVDACQVNGMPHPAGIAPDNRGFIINWVADEQAATKPLEIQLDLKRVGLRTALGGSLVASVPRVASSRWTIALPESTPYVDIQGATGATKVSSDRRHFDIDAGPSSTLEMRWSQTPPEPRALKIEAAQLQFLDLRSTHGEMRFRFRCEPQDCQLDFVDFDLPARSVVREGDVRAPHLLRTEVFAGPQGQSRLRLTFAEPQKEKFTVDGTLLIVAPEGISHLSLPQFGLTRSAEVRVTTTQNWWCVGAPPEYRLEHQNLEQDLVGNLTAAEFLQAWGESPPTGRVQLVFQPREKSAIQFTVTPQVPRRRALSWTQSGVVGRRRIEWTLTARLETSQAPVYQHFLLVDRRLQIESISVIEAGAERRDRWYENRSGTSPTRVVIFLSDKTSGVQQLVVKASMPTRYGRPVPLPFIRCEEAELADARWELYHERDVEVDVQLPRGTPAFEPEEDATVEAGPELVARYQTTDPDPRTAIRVSAVQARCTARTVAAVTRSDGQSWKLAGQVTLKPEGESPRRMGVMFPVSIDPARVMVDRADASWHEPVDGHRRLDLTLLPDPDDVVISFDTTIEEPARGDWVLPLPEPQEAATHQVHLLVAPVDAWTPLEGTELKPGESPPWATEVLSKLRSDQLAAEYQLNGLPLSLQRSATPTHLEQPEIRLLDHCLWQVGDECIGVSRAYLSQTRDAIEFAVPDGFEPIAVFLDDRPLSMPVPVEQKLTIPLVGGARESRLVMTWKIPQARTSQMVRLTHDDLPSPLSLEPRRTLVTVIPDRQDMAVPRDRRQQLHWMDSALDRLEMLLDRQESLGTDPRAAAANRRLIVDLQAQITRQIPSGLDRPTPVVMAQVQRWNRIVAALNQLEQSPSLPEVPEPTAIRGAETAFVDLPGAIRMAVDPAHPAVTFWQLDRGSLDLVGALLIGLVAIPVFRRIIRLDWGEWLSLRSTLAWMLLGLVWWIWLTPAPLGPLMMAITLLRAGIHRRQSQNSVMVVEGPSSQ